MIDLLYRLEHFSVGRGLNGETRGKREKDDNVED